MTERKKKKKYKIKYTDFHATVIGMHTQVESDYVWAVHVKKLKKKNK